LTAFGANLASDEFMKNKTKLKVPRFASEAEEREFWETRDTADYFDLEKAVPASFPNLKPSTISISSRDL